MAHGEWWIAKEIYRREVTNLKISTPLACVTTMIFVWVGKAHQRTRCYMQR